MLGSLRNAAAPRCLERLALVGCREGGLRRGWRPGCGGRWVYKGVKRGEEWAWQALGGGGSALFSRMETQTLLQITVSLALGLLLGLQRQRTDASVGGIRTFPFFALLGTVCAKIAVVYGGWIVAAGLLALAAVLVFANVLKMKVGSMEVGITSEVAALLLYAVGILLASNEMAAGVLIGGVMLLLLHLKQPMHQFAAAVGERDMRAIAQFVLISLIILPVLPHASYGPYGVWNPFSIWLMVVFIVGISLSGYVAYKLFGARNGALLGGVIGGLVSSTATAVSFARRAARDASLAPLGAFVIMASSCISLLRVLVEVVAAAPGAAGEMVPPLAVLLGVSVVLAGGLYALSYRQTAEMPVPKNPAELRGALVFGLLYAGVLWAVAVARDGYGAAGLYTVAVLSGLTDVDAITLSSAQLVQSGSLAPATAWRAILIAVLANSSFKFAVVAVLGGRHLAFRLGGAVAVVLGSGALLLRWWPQ